MRNVEGTSLELRSVAAANNEFCYATDPRLLHGDQNDTRSGKFAQSREPLDIRVKAQQVQMLDVAEGGRMGMGGRAGVESYTYQYHEKPRRWRP